MDKLALQKMAVEVRKGIVSSVHSAKAGHPGGSLSAADIFTYLYFEEMNIDPKDPKKEDRDRFVLSKGHTAPGLYSALANRGYFPVEDLLTEIIAASIRNPIHVTDCALAGAHIATVPYKVIEQMTKHPLTDAGIEKFQADYRAVFGD